MMAYENTFAFRLLQKFETMRERVQNYVSVVDQCPLPVFIITRDAKSVLHVNAAFKNLFGIDVEDMQDFGWLAVIHPDDREDVKHSFCDFGARGPENMRTTYRRRYLTRGQQMMSAMLYATIIPNDGIVGYIVPTDCLFMLALGIDLGCPVQKAKLAAMPA